MPVTAFRLRNKSACQDTNTSQPFHRDCLTLIFNVRLEWIRVSRKGAGFLPVNDGANLCGCHRNQPFETPAAPAAVSRRLEPSPKFFTRTSAIPLLPQSFVEKRDKLGWSFPSRRVSQTDGEPVPRSADGEIILCFRNNNTC